MITLNMYTFVYIRICKRLIKRQKLLDWIKKARANYMLSERNQLKHKAIHRLKLK